MNKLVLAIASLFLMLACSESTEKDSNEKVETSFSENELDNLKLEAIIDSVYQINGSGIIDKSNITFDFREYKYSRVFSDSGLVRSREFVDKKEKKILDVWHGDYLNRSVDGEVIELSKKDEKTFINSINSVFYFAFLPKALKDPAVNLDLVDEVEINEKMYYKIKVTFNEEGGGEDFHDVFLYWIGIEDYSMDYMAYQYFTNDGGIRFRVVDKIQEVNGILFKDYLNYAPKENMMNDYMSVDKVFVSGGMKLVSEIRLENIVVE